MLIHRMCMSYTIKKNSLPAAVYYSLLLSSTSDLQPSTAIANQLPDHLVSTQIRTIRLNCFIFVIALIVPSTKVV